MERWTDELQLASRLAARGKSVGATAGVESSESSPSINAVVAEAPLITTRDVAMALVLDSFSSLLCCLARMVWGETGLGRKPEGT